MGQEGGLVVLRGTVGSVLSLRVVVRPPAGNGRGAVGGAQVEHVSVCGVKEVRQSEREIRIRAHRCTCAHGFTSPPCLRVHGVGVEVLWASLLNFGPNYLQVSHRGF
eukprot:259807-Prorocentrum_minimum.AAC.2